MNAGSNSRVEEHHELIGTLKFAGWIALVVLAIIAVVILCGK